MNGYIYIDIDDRNTVYIHTIPRVKFIIKSQTHF